MGAVSPPAGFDAAAQAAALDGIIRPVLAEMARRGTPFRGVLFAGLMLTADGPRLIEYNVRLGDPEAQVLLPRLRSDLLPALLAACDGELGAFDLRWRDIACVGVVVAARGYPGEYVKGSVIRGLERADAVPHVQVFQGGTALRGGQLVSAGGRVLTVTGVGPDIGAARDAAYAGIAALDWPDGVWRRDIGMRALARAGVVA
jgi:phosphoribosylamine--glycine ligase